MAGQKAAIFVVVGLLVGAGGFLLGSLIGNENSDPTGSVPTGITTKDSSTRIPTLGDAAQIPALDLPPEESEPAEAEAETESSGPVTESQSGAEPEEEASQSPPSSSSSPEVTVAPTE